MLGERAQDDPFADLIGAVCNLLGDALGARYGAVFQLESEELTGATSEFMRLPQALKRRAIDDVASTLTSLSTDRDDPRLSGLIDVPVPRELGASRAGALYFRQSDTVVFAVPPADLPLALETFRSAAAGVLPILERLDRLRRERTELAQAQLLLAHVGELAKVGGWEQSLATGRFVWSDEIFSIHGLEPGGEVSLERMLSLYPSPAREKLSLELERAAAEGGSFDLTAPIKTPLGERRVVRTMGRAHKGQKGRYLYGITQDVTTQLSAERRLWWAANHDPVTSLPNRLLFEDRIGVAVQRAKREETRFALLIIEISDIARMVDRSGYTVPDKHMMEVAARLVSVSRSSDTIARLSLNEFAILLDNVDSHETLEPVLVRLREQIAQMQASESGGDGVVMSCGISFFPTHAFDADNLMRAAEMALAKARGKLSQPIIVFDRQLADDAERRRETILGRARESLAKREFVPFYQPQIDIETNQVVGVEALVRWQTPDMILDAKDFAYALDDHEIGSRVGRAVLDAVIADIASLRQMTERPFRVSVNASRTEVLRNDFLDTFLEKARNNNLKPTDFIIEITEDVIIGVDDQTLQDKISFLVSSGVEFSLDDFGTGYASLIHISSFPVKEIKIDKQFVTGIESDRRKRAIVKGIIQIARSMGLNIIAEGVETVEQQEVLRSIGCRYAQGYLYSFPVPFNQFAAMLDA